MSSSEPDLLIVNDFGPALTKRTESLGGSEHELVLLAHAFARTGRRVVFANVANTTDETIDGVRYVSSPRAAGITRARAVILARTTPMPDGLTWGRAVVRVTDNFTDAHNVNAKLLAREGALLVPMSAWQGQQPGFQALSKNQRVISPMIQPSPPHAKKPYQHVFASWPPKGLAETLQCWAALHDSGRMPSAASLVIASPGHYVRHDLRSFLSLTQHQLNRYNIRYAGVDPLRPQALSTDEYLRILGESEALFYVNSMLETFGMVASLAERAHCRPHILALNGPGGLTEALDDARFLTTSPAEFLTQVSAYTGKTYTPPKPHTDRSPEAMLPKWEQVLYPSQAKVISMSSAPIDVLLVNSIGPGFTHRTKSLGGSELELVQIAQGLAAHGRRVVVANGVDEEQVLDGVRYVPLSRLRTDETLKRARCLYLERTTPIDYTAPDAQYDHVVVRATDIYFAGYDVHRNLLGTKKYKTTLAVNTRWQGKLFEPLTKEYTVISPMLGPTPKVERIRGRFVYASAPIKGLGPTLDEWRYLWRHFPRTMKAANPELIIVTPGHFDYYGDKVPELTNEDLVDFRVSYKGSPSLEEYRAEIARAEGLFYVNQMPETYGNVAAFAERSGTRPHILCLFGKAGLEEALIDWQWLTTDLISFREAFLDALKNPPDWKAPERPDQSPEAMIPKWDALLLPPASIEVSSHDFAPPEPPKPAKALKRVDPNDDWGVDQILVHGIYKIPFLKDPKVILDIGANIGAATVFFKREYPNARVFAYEPHPRARAVLEENVRGLTSVTVDERAVATPHEHFDWVRLYEGKCGPDPKEVDVSQSHKVSVLSPEALPEADILKIDTEGCEVEILEGYLESASSAHLQAIALEWHSPQDHAKILKLLAARGFVIVRDVATCAIRGDLVAVHMSPIADRLLPCFDTFKMNMAQLDVPTGLSAHWGARSRELKHQAETQDGPFDFLRWTEDLDISDMPCFHNWYGELSQDPQWWARWLKLTRKAPWGNPRLFQGDDGTSPVCVQHAYHLYRYEKAHGSLTQGIDIVVELGGGHGNFARMLREDGYRGPHVIIDLPHVREFQRLYLSLCEVPLSSPLKNGDGVTDIVDDGVTLLTESDIPTLLLQLKGKRVAFVSTFGLSETPHTLRDKLFPAIHQHCTKYLLAVLGWPKWFDIDNEQFFNKLVKDSGAEWAPIAPIEGFIENLKSATRYLFGKRTGAVKAASLSAEQTFPADPTLDANREHLGPLYGDLLSLLRSSISPGGSEYGLGVMLFALAVATRPRQIVEIGRFKGFATLAFAAALKLQRIGWNECMSARQRPGIDYDTFAGNQRPLAVVSIDPHPTPEAEELLTRAGVRDYVVMIDKPSQETDIKGPIDILFIDGSHALNDLRADVQRFVPWVNPGGYFILHDFYGWFRPSPTGVPENGSPVAQVIREDLAGFDQILIDTGFASFVIFRKTQSLTEPKDLEPRVEKVPARADGRPTVGLCMIAKGAEVSTVLARAIGSIKHQVDAVTVVCDASPEDAHIAEMMGAQVHIRKTPAVDWERGIGFIAGARNDAIAIAERRTDYVLMVDPDDYYVGVIPQTLDKDAYEVVIRDADVEYARVQLFRSGAGFRYTGIRHECLETHGSYARLETLFYMRGHSAYGHQDQDPQPVKFMKHARDLERWLIGHPEDARALFYLAGSYRDAGQKELAISTYEKRIKVGGWPEEVYQSALHIASLRSELGEDPTSDYLRAHQLGPQKADALMHLARWHRDERRKNFELAYLFAKQAATIPKPEGALFLRPAIYQWEALAELGICAYWANRKPEALGVFRQLVTRVPPDKKAWAESQVALCKRETGA